MKICMLASNSKPKIIYIAGSPHSGSTLLDQILATAPNTFSVGEVKHLDKFLQSDSTIVDDTGARAVESDFWYHFVKQKKDFIPKAGASERLLSWYNRASIMVTGKPAKVPRRYKNNVQLYQTISEIAEEKKEEKIETIIDCSKVLSRLVEIKERTDLEVFVIHIVRDVRGVAASHKKRGNNPITWGVRWLISNLGIARYVRKNFYDYSYITISYEDLVRNPEAVINSLVEMTGCRLDYDSLIDSVNHDVSYRFGGNGLRQREFTGIHPDTSWPHRLSRLQQIILAPLNVIAKLFIRYDKVLH